MDHETAALTMIKSVLEPLDQYPGSAKPWRCRCLRCGAVVMPRHGNIQQGWGGCRSCGQAASAARSAVRRMLRLPR
jgi:hypothetical protein